MGRIRILSWLKLVFSQQWASKLEMKVVVELQFQSKCFRFLRADSTSPTIAAQFHVIDVIHVIVGCWNNFHRHWNHMIYSAQYFHNNRNPYWHIMSNNRQLHQQRRLHQHHRQLHPVGTISIVLEPCDLLRAILPYRHCCQPLE